MELKLLSQAEVDTLDDAEVEKYHHQLQIAGDAIVAAKLAVKHDRDARVALVMLPAEARAKVNARVIRMHGEAQGKKQGDLRK